jgi:hypothetical protein
MSLVVKNSASLICWGIADLLTRIRKDENISWFEAIQSIDGLLTSMNATDVYWTYIQPTIDSGNPSCDTPAGSTLSTFYRLCQAYKVRKLFKSKGDTSLDFKSYVLIAKLDVFEGRQVNVLFVENSVHFQLKVLPKMS